jgi:hypothetical protein
MAVTLNASTSTGYIQTADTSGDLALQSNGTTQFNVTSTGAYGQLKSGTAVTASGTSVDFTSIPSWVKRITVVFNGVSTNGTSNLLLQLGDSGGIENTGYTSRSQTTGASATSTAGFILTVSLSTSADTFNGAVFLNFLSANTWTESAIINHTGQNVLPYSAGSKTLSDVLTQVRITTVNGTDTFDAGTINILYEG